MLTTSACTDSPERALDALCLHANSAERICERIEEFIDRCRGHEPAMNAKSATLAQVPSGHFGQLERLSVALDRAENLARELANIG